MVPVDAQGVTEGERINARGQKLFTVTYRAQGAQKAVYAHAHGYGEHVGRMRHCESISWGFANGTSSS